MKQLSRAKLLSFLKLYYRILLYSFFICMVVCVILMKGICYQEITPQESYFRDLTGVNFNSSGCQLLTPDEMVAKETFYYNHLWGGVSILVLMLFFNWIGNRKKEGEHQKK